MGLFSRRKIEVDMTPKNATPQAMPQAQQQPAQQAQQAEKPEQEMPPEESYGADWDKQMENTTARLTLKGGKKYLLHELMDFAAWMLRETEVENVELEITREINGIGRVVQVKNE